ncbi:MAG TPA: hypothetical protein VNT02_13240 [Burkholderiales bacterium]|nr:hypothetical protein [Burkholderiales bacterium]
MQYMFYNWRARTPGSAVWQELGWRMTEEDARRWAETHGREIERVAGVAHADHKAYGGALG